MEIKQKSTESENIDNGVLVKLSSEMVDRDGDIIRQNGINFDNYKKNPVVLWAHNPSMPPIGKINVDTIEVKNGATYGAVEFASTPFAQEIKTLYDDNILNAWSIGFKVTDFDKIKGGYDITESELYELSAVPVPANPEALTQRIKSIENNDIAKMMRKSFGIQTDAEIKRECEKLLKKCGYSGSEAKAIAAGKKEVARGNEKTDGEKLANIFKNLTFIKEAKNGK